MIHGTGHKGQCHPCLQAAARRRISRANSDIYHKMPYPSRIRCNTLQDTIPLDTDNAAIYSLVHATH